MNNSPSVSARGDKLDIVADKSLVKQQLYLDRLQKSNKSISISIKSIKLSEIKPTQEKELSAKEIYLKTNLKHKRTKSILINNDSTLFFDKSNGTTGYAMNNN